MKGFIRKDGTAGIRGDHAQKQPDQSGFSFAGGAYKSNHLAVFSGEFDTGENSVAILIRDANILHINAAAFGSFDIGGGGLFLFKLCKLAHSLCCN